MITEHGTQCFRIICIGYSSTDFSYPHCIAQQPPSRKQEVSQAFRRAVRFVLYNARGAFFSTHGDGREGQCDLRSYGRADHPGRCPYGTSPIDDLRGDRVIISLRSRPVARQSPAHDRAGRSDIPTSDGPCSVRGVSVIPLVCGAARSRAQHRQSGTSEPTSSERRACLSGSVTVISILGWSAMTARSSESR